MLQCFAFFLLALSFSNMSIVQSNIDPTHSSECPPPKEFGFKIGSNRGVVAYSNGCENFVSEEPHVIRKGGKDICTGMKWQCVEYARRWLNIINNISFRDVDYAVDIPDTEGYDLRNGRKTKRTVYENGINSASLKIGDLIIYETTYAPTTGHVAVVVGVQKDKVLIAEQNNRNTLWDGKDFSRSLPYTVNDQGVYNILETGLICWVRFHR